jgi:hypothetical protein
LYVTLGATPKVTGLCFAVATHAGTPSPVTEYSADIYQKMPQGTEVTGRVYVGKSGMRTDMDRDGEKVIQLIDTQNKISRILYPAQRSYMEFPSGPAMQTTSDQGGEVNPCKMLPGAQCRKLGEEKMNGRPTVKWEISFSQQGKQIKGTQWIDQERGMVVRQEMPNGQRSELKLLGTEELSGRKVEKWEVDMYQGGNRQRSFRWYDPALNLVVREVMPGGYVREMRNIQVGSQDPALFQVPPGFKKVDPRHGGDGQSR